MMTNRTTPIPTPLRALAALLAAAALCSGAWAAGPQSTGARSAGTTPHPSQASDPIGPQLQGWIEQAAAANWSTNVAPHGGADAGSGDAGGAGVRIEVTLGHLNPGLRLAPCARIEPFLPPNTRLWGRSFVGVRCAEGASWTTMMPVTVSVYGPALVANLPIAHGALADPADFRIEEVDLTRSRGQPVSDPALLEGRAIGRPLRAGQLLQANDLRTPQTIMAGDPIRIRLVGQGFSISTEGFAMAGAGEGQALRVRTGTGKLLVGTVQSRTVVVRM